MSSRQTSRAGGKNWQKAKYKMDSVNAVKGSRRAPSRQTLPTRYTRGETGTIFTEGTAVTRDLYVAPPGYDTPSMRRFREYLEETGLEEKFKQLLTLLLDRAELPYNPYPGFVQRFRQHAEAFHMNQDSDSKIQHLLRNNIRETYMPNLFTVRGYEMVWGLSSIMQAVSPQKLAKYKWLVDDMTPQQEDLYSVDDYTNQVTVALVGPCIFEGTFYTHIYNVQLRKEFLISGEDIQQGVSVFVNSVMTEIDSMYTNPRHLILGVNIPYGIEEETEKVALFDFWDPDRIQSNKMEFLQAMSDTVINNKYIYMECIFRVDPDYMSYMRGQVQFCLNFIETTQNTDSSESLSSFAEFPMASLHEGVFLTRSHAESYLSIFTPQIEHSEDQDPLPPSSPGSGNKMTVGGPPGTNRAPSAQTNRPFTRAQKQDLGVVRRHVYDKLKQLHPHRVRIDGFRLGDERATGPFAWQITSPLKSYLQQKIASHHLHAELFESCYCAILLVLLERDKFDPQLEIELYRLLHGTAGRLYNAMEQNKSLRYIVRGFSDMKETSVIREHLAMYKETILHLFESDLNVRSSEQITVGRMILNQVDDLLCNDTMPFASAPHIQLSKKTLKNLNWYCLALMIQLAEDCLPRAPNFRDLVDTMQKNFPEIVPRPITRHRTRRDPKGSDMDTDVVHGVEDEHIKNHERYVIDVEACMEKDNTIPKGIAKEGVLLKYVIDSHLDQIWHDFLLDLATKDHFPPNPYPFIVSVLRQAAMRMDLCYEKDDIIAKNLWASENMKLEDEENFVYYVPGVDCHGTFSALALLDTGPYVPLSDQIKVFEQKNFIQRKGPYRVAICMAVSGPSILYGKMQPYLNEVELHEHIYIRGPPGCQGEATQLFATIVHTHLSEMIKEGRIPVMGIYFGDLQTRWTWEEVLTKKIGFLTECTTACANKETIFMKAFLFIEQWRYVPVRKYFLLHFISDDDVDAEIFYPDNPVAFYQSIFLTKDRAAFHYQNGGPKSGGDPMSSSNIRATQQFLDQMLAEAKARGDWLTVHRGLMLKSLLYQNSHHLAESWRMLHSIAATVEYVMSLVDTLQDIVQLFLEYMHFNKERYESTSQPPTQNTQSKKNRGKGTAATKASRDSRSDLEGPLDEAQFGRMVMIFHEKLKETCSSRIALTGSPLSGFLLSKLKTAEEEDPELYNFYLAYEEQTLFRLEEIKQMLKMIKDTTSSDIHDVCPLAQAVIDNIESDVTLTMRPISVASNRLNNPNEYRRTLAPQMKTILE